MPAVTNAPVVAIMPNAYIDNITPVASRRVMIFARGASRFLNCHIVAFPLVVERCPTAEASALDPSGRGGGAARPSPENEIRSSDLRPARLEYGVPAVNRLGQ